MAGRHWEAPGTLGRHAGRGHGFDGPGARPAVTGGRRWSRRVPRRPAVVPGGCDALYAVVTAYMEGDVIAATVANARRQGCDRVLLVDNDSPDDTVAQAEGAGAELARRYRTPQFDLARSMALVREVMAEATAAAGGPVWWLVLDADEFPHGPGGATVRQHLAGLDGRCEVVGARVFTHFPAATPGTPANVPGRHPLDVQPLCQEVRVPQCPAGHWKHPLVRWGHGADPPLPTRGQHRARAGHRLVEAPEPVFLHHFQYRQPEATAARLRRLCEPGPDGVVRNGLNDRRQGRPSGITERWRALDAAYGGRFAEVPGVTRHGHVPGVAPAPWAELVGPADAEVARWYGAEEGGAPAP